MDRISAPEQNRLLGRLADLLRTAESPIAAPEFLPPQLDVMSLVRSLMLPSAQTVEKMSYGDPLFRMPQQSRIPITADREYLADVAGMLPLGAPAARPSARAMQDLVRQIQTEPPVGAVNIPQTPSVPKSDIGFYSQLEAAVQPLQNKGTGQQYLSQIQKTPGVKPEEIQWTGLDTFLKGRQSVTKQEINDYLKNNQVRVSEKTLVSPEARDKMINDALPSNYSRLSDGTYYDEISGEFIYESDLPDDIKNAIRMVTDKFSESNYGYGEYVLPGGQNYREILLTLPARERIVETQVPAGTRPKVFENTSTGRFELLDSYGEPGAVFNTRAEAEKAADEIAAPFVKSETVRDPEFYSSHFDQPNILAHMRVNDRVVDGKKTLFIEEIQSDWHQAGRKKGYGPQGVPDAPFKTSWHELTLKKAIQEASEKGYDQIAFTTGKTQAARYDLSRQAKEVRHSANKDGTYDLFVVPFGDGRGRTMRNVNQTDVEYLVGKELAQKIIAGEGRQMPDAYKSLTGVNLEIGGEGMKGFYDQILPKSLEKLAKKFNAKVGKTEMDGVEVWQMDITPQMRESVTTKGQPLFAIPAIGTGLLGAGMMQEEEQF